MIKSQDIFSARILIVDDLQVNVSLLERLLAQAGYVNVSATTEPTQVRALHRQSAYDLILLDLQMPGTDGFEVMEQLKQDMGDSYLPVVALTAQPAHKLRALKAGAKDFISKPFDLLEVTARIYNVLEVRLLYRELERHNDRLEKTVEQRTAELRESEQRFRRLTALASDWYWEQDETGDFTHVSGPVLPMVGIRMTAFLGDPMTAEGAEWRHEERAALRQKIVARQPFIDFAFSRINTDGSEQQFRVSGEPIFNDGSQFTGYRGVGVEVTAKVPM